MSLELSNICLFLRSSYITFINYPTVCTCILMLAFYLRNSWYTKGNEKVAADPLCQFINSDQCIGFILVTHFSFGSFAYNIFLPSCYLSFWVLLKSQAFPVYLHILLTLLCNTENSVTRDLTWSLDSSTDVLHHSAALPGLGTSPILFIFAMRVTIQPS